jgi:YD repeat-containing protein
LRKTNCNLETRPDTVSYAYDALGRVTKETVAGQAESFVYDNLGRISGDSNALGNFNETYLGETGQLTTEVLAGTALSATYTYEANTADRRLKSILHNALQLAYTTDDDGNVLSETGTSVNNTYAYDAVNRLTSVGGTVKTQGILRAIPGGGATRSVLGSTRYIQGVVNVGAHVKSASYTYDGVSRREHSYVM